MFNYLINSKMFPLLFPLMDYTIFNEIGNKFASSIPSSSEDFERFMKVLKTVLQKYTHQDEELEEVFNSLKSNKRPGILRHVSKISTQAYF